MLSVFFGCTPAGDTELERNSRRRLISADILLVKRNNIRFTVAFAESYRKNSILGINVFCAFLIFLVAEQSAIFYWYIRKKGKC